MALTTLFMYQVIAGCDSSGRDNLWRDEDPNAVF